jgi:serine/threonine protein kinase/Tol biopolymer transport system component
MGEVYRATDTNLGRQVAIKVLPEAFAHDADRLARFEREARTLASLNHSNIAIVHGLERIDDGRALVMELVEGPTVADRIAQGPLPLDEAIPIARQIAAALEAAHEQGIVHRDLKPANIKVRRDGVVKVLDFGLAKALESAGAPHPLVDSPTITSPAMLTRAGMVLGTAAYMSPEQARGKVVDKRTDIWAFGAVVYEMLSGRRAFAGADVSDVLASVLAREPDWTWLPANLSPVLVAFLKRCLQKDPRQRIRDIGDVTLALDGAFDRAVSSRPPPPASLSGWRRILPVAATGLIAVLITSLAAWGLWPREAARSPSRLEYLLPDGQLLQPTQRPVIAMSADGSAFVYQTPEGLYLRSMDALEARLIPGTQEGLVSPFFSPDGQWVAYFATNGGLKKVAVSGGTPGPLCPATFPFGATWSRDNTILFGQAEGIMRVSGDGGAPQLVVPAVDGELIYGPQLLPGNAVLFSVTKGLGPARWDEGQIVVQSLSSGERTVLVQGGSDARYIPTGHLVYAQRDGLFGARLNLTRLTVADGRIPLVPGLQRPVGVIAVGLNYAISETGTLVYLGAIASRQSLVWVDRTGATEPIRSIPPGPYQEPRLAPDGARALVTKNGDVWIYDLASGRSSNVTRDGASQMGVWDPSGTQVAYASAKAGNLEAWVTSSDGSGQPRQLTKLGGQVHVDSWSPDGRLLTIHHHRPEATTPTTARDSRAILMLAMDRADAEPEVFFEAKVTAEGANLSRDGHYVAYVSQESGQREIYIRAYPGPGGQETVSVGGAQEPIWAGNGELFYRSLDGRRMFAVPVTTAPTLKVGTSVELFQGSYYFSPAGSPRAQYDVTSDGRRLLMLAPTPETTTTSPPRPRIVVVQNWFEELKRLLPPE